MKEFIIKYPINTIIFGVYMFLIWSIYLYTNYYKNCSNTIIFFILLCLITIMIFLISNILISNIRKIHVKKSKILTKKISLILFFIFFIISFGILYLWFIAYYPGAFSPDSIDQYTQAISGNYNDWHPTWHTILFFTVPLILTGKTESVVLLQIIWFALALAYFALNIYRLANFKVTVLSLGYILLNPYTGCIAMFPWKDVAMAITIFLAMVFILEIYYTNKPKENEVWIAILLANATIFRHNAVLFTIPMIWALFFQLNKIKWLKMIIIFFTFIFIVKFPIYSILNVKPAEQGHIEIMGLPLTVLANVTQEHPEVLDQKTSNFVYQIATPQEWNEKYICGNFNSIKWSGIDGRIIEETNIIDILSMTIKCFSLSPHSSCEALFTLTDMVYSVEGELKGDVFPYIENNDLGIIYHGNDTLKNFLMCYKKIVSNTIFKYVQYIGVSILAMLVFIFGKIDFTKWNDWKKILLCIPIFIYDFGTMLLLTGPDSRFFYVNYLVCPVIILITLKNEEEIL